MIHPCLRQRFCWQWKRVTTQEGDDDDDDADDQVVENGSRPAVAVNASARPRYQGEHCLLKKRLPDQHELVQVVRHSVSLTNGLEFESLRWRKLMLEEFCHLFGQLGSN